jgi:hypothetical protein
MVGYENVAFSGGDMFKALDDYPHTAHREKRARPNACHFDCRIARLIEKRNDDADRTEKNSGENDERIGDQVGAKSGDLAFFVNGWSGLLPAG